VLWHPSSKEILKYVYLHTTNSLSVQYMNSKHDSRLVMKYAYRGSTLSFKLIGHFGMTKCNSHENVMNMTSRILCKFLVVPTFVARRLHSFKDARDPSGETWNYLSRRLYCNFAEMIAYTTFRDLFWISKHVLVQIGVFVSECSTYSLSMPSVSMDHDSNQVMNFVYIRSDCSVAVLNKGL